MPAASYGNVLEMIGNTPLMAVRRIDTGPCELFLKLENQNPGGSIKDRIGLYLIPLQVIVFARLPGLRPTQARQRPYPSRGRTVPGSPAV